jgi:hypothetical protein
MYDMSLGDALLNGVETGAIGIVAGGVGGGAGSFIDGYGFFAGALSGAAGGASGGFVGGAISGWSSGENFGDGLVSGINAAWKGAIIGGVAGGISSGISSYGSDRSFWTGAPQQEVVLKINLAGEGELVSLSDYRNSSAETRAYYRTLLRNNDAITTNSRGVTNIKLPRNISRVNGIEAEGGFVDPDASFEIGRRNISVTFIETPNYINLYGYRYQSNTSSFSLKNLIYH